LTVKVYDTKIGQVVLAVLCDGMGGLEKGEVASASLIRRFERWVDEELENLIEERVRDSELRRQWENLVLEEGRHIMDYGKQQGVSLGTTVTALLLTPTRYYIVNVGDTRAYRIQIGRLECITKDHTLVAHEVETGVLTPAQAEMDSRRSVLLQCVGASEQIYPDFFFGDTTANTVFMLCSDGFRHEITEEEMYRMLNPDVLQNEMVMNQNALTLIRWDKARQESDNISVILIRTYLKENVC
jgi:serine/threonine protein phosphatase PrpC